jgi:hypothetical protein
LYNESRPPRPADFPVRPVASRRGGDYGENRDISPSDSSDYISDYSEKGLAEHRRRQQVIREVQKEVRSRHEERTVDGQNARMENQVKRDQVAADEADEARDRYQEQQRDAETGRFF